MRKHRLKVWTYDPIEDRYGNISESSLANLALGPAAKRARSYAKRQELAARATVLFKRWHSKAYVASVLKVSVSTLNRALAEYRPKDPLLD